MKKWQLQEAKARLSELIRKAAREGPQPITVHGELTAVVLSAEEFERIRQPRPRFKAWMRSSPLVGLDLDLRREQTPIRAIDVS